MFLAASQKSDGSYGTNLSTLDNVVFDDFSSGATSLGSITALGNELTTSTNVYPPALNQLLAGSDKETKDIQGTHAVLQNNTYDSMTSVNDPSLAYPCLGTMPFVNGELFASQGTQLAVGAATNLRTVSLAAGDSITLNAVVQPDHVADHTLCAGQLWQAARAAFDRLAGTHQPGSVLRWFRAHRHGQSLR